MKKYFVLAAFALLLSSCQRSLEDQAENALKEYNDKNCPVRLSEYVTMDSCSFDRATHTLQYYYHLTGSMDRDSIDNQAEMREGLLNGLKNDMSTRVYKEAGYNFLYTYYSERTPEKKLFEAHFTKEDY